MKLSPRVWQRSARRRARAVRQQRGDDLSAVHFGARAEAAAEEGSDRAHLATSAICGQAATFGCTVVRRHWVVLCGVTPPPLDVRTRQAYRIQLHVRVVHLGEGGGLLAHQITPRSKPGLTRMPPNSACTPAQHRCYGLSSWIATALAFHRRLGRGAAQRSRQSRRGSLSCALGRRLVVGGDRGHRVAQAVADLVVQCERTVLRHRNSSRSGNRRRVLARCTRRCCAERRARAAGSSIDDTCVRVRAAGTRPT